LEKLAKAAGGDKAKLLEVLATQQRWDWADVAVLLTGSNAAVVDFIKAQEEATQKRTAEATAAAEKWREVQDKALAEGGEATTWRYVTTTTQQPAPGGVATQQPQHR
jgi:ribosomal silencing factor RsfS